VADVELRHAFRRRESEDGADSGRALERLDAGRLRARQQDVPRQRTAILLGVRSGWLT
jgi:hypothetical protein